MAQERSVARLLDLVVAPCAPILPGVHVQDRVAWCTCVGNPAHHITAWDVAAHYGQLFGAAALRQLETREEGGSTIEST